MVEVFFPLYDKFYMENRMPFGQRISSLYMQRISNIIISILRAQGHRAVVYLDDILLIGSSRAEAQAAFQATIDLLMELGVENSVEKAI